MQNKLQHIWAAGRSATNAWLTIPSPWTTELMAAAGFDSVTIDLQHGLIGYETAVAMLQAMSGSDAVPLARLEWNDPATIMRMLDAGALGLICPLINTAAECAAFVGACRYPPAGYRSYGPIRGRFALGARLLRPGQRERDGAGDDRDRAGARKRGRDRGHARA